MFNANPIASLYEKFRLHLLETAQNMQSSKQTRFFDARSDRKVEGYRLGYNPYGDFFCIPFMLTSVAWFLSICAHQLCRFLYREITLQYAYQSELVDISQFFPPANTTTGIWSYQGVGIFEGICFRYPSTFKIDSSFQAARVFSVLVSFIGALAMFRIWFAACIPFGTTSWKCTGIYLLFCCLLEGLTMLQFNSSKLCNGGLTVEGFIYQTKCKFDQGSRFAVAAIILWFLSSLSIFYLGMNSFCLQNNTVQNQGDLAMVAVKKISRKTKTIAPDGTVREIQNDEHLEYV